MTSTNAHDPSYDTALAIIGMSGRFPGAQNVEAFWHNIAAGVKSIRTFSDEALLEAGVERAQLDQPNYVKAGAVLEGIEQFDAPFFGYSPREAETMDPQHRLLLECAWEALEEGGYDPETYHGLVGIFAGSGFSTYLVHNLYTNPELLETIGQLQMAVGNERDSLVSTVSYKLNLKGPALAVQTFCSTSLVAVHLACQSLLTYECDLALAGGVAITVPQLTGYLYEEGGIVSPDGQCRSFDAEAQGSVMGNGLGVVTLKRLADALHDGDHIHALIRGSAVNNDGSVRVSYTAPGLDGQSEVIAEALGHAAVPIETIGYIEAHGTATHLGDAVELAAMHKAFAASTAGYGSCAIGSVKPNVGHLDRASGVTGLIKTVQALRHGQLPPSLNCEHPSAELDLEHSPFYVNTQLRPWPRGDTPRRAGVSSFGLGGTNAHVVLEEAPPAQPVAASRPWQLLVLSAKSETALQQAARNLAQHLRAHPEQALADVAYTLQVGRSAFSHRQALVCGSREEAIGLLEGSEPSRVASSHLLQREPGVVFLFPGLGEQHLGSMASQLAQHEPHFRQTVEQCCALLKQHGVHLEQLLLADLSSKGGSAVAAQTALGQPAAFVVEYALAQQLIHWGIGPQALLGSSLGEYVAACLAGVFSLQDALWLVAQRAILLEELPPGAMLAVALSEIGVQPYLDDLVEMAAVTGPTTCVLAGPLEAIEQVQERLQELEVEQRRLDTQYASHCSLLAPLQAKLTDLVRKVELHAPSMPLISNVTGTWLTDEQASDPSYWAQQLCQTVRFAAGVEQVGRMGQPGQQVGVEVGVGQVLASLVSQHPAWSPQSGQQVLSTLPSGHEPGSAQAALLGTLGHLWLNGVSVDWPGFYAQEQRQRVSLPTYPFERQRYWIEPNKLTYNVAKASTMAIDDEEKIEDLSDWFYVPSWKQALAQQPFALSDIPVETEHWLLFIDDYGIGTQVAQQLEQYHQDVTIVRPGTAFGRSGEASYTVDISSRSDYEQLLRELRTAGKAPHNIVHMGTVTPDSPEQAEQDEMTAVSDMLNAGFYSLLALAQALGDVGIDTCHITIISSNMQDVTGDERLRPEKATIIGPCRVIPQEYSNIDCRSIDIILPQAGRKQEELVVRQLLGELTSDLSHTVVAFRGTHRWLQTFEPVRLSSQDTRDDMLRYGGVYLITGGLGGIGLAMADYLARTLQARLVLVTRSGLPPRSEWGCILQEQGDIKGVGQQIRKVQALESQGAEVLICRANIADETQMRHVVEQALATFGTLNGVLHAAGVPASGLMQLKAPELPAGVFAPKVMGTLILERVLRKLPLDFLILFSSMSSTTGGGPGQVDYCAANAYLDVYARKNFTKHGMTIAVNWGEWQWDAWDAGLQGYPQEAQTYFREKRQKFGISFEEGTEALRRILSRKIPQVVVSTADFPTIVESSRHFSIATILERLKELRQSKPGYARPMLDIGYVAPGNDLECQVAAVWSELLGITEIGIHDNFFELGGNSLMGTQLVSRLRRVFEVDMPLATIFQALTVEELALNIKLMLLDEIDQLDEEEVQHLA